jgi:hydroxymethylglutaryl-CoA lyase
MDDWPQVIYTEEAMREGMQIEDAGIPVDDKVALLDALSETGLKRIVVGSFVSPKWTPQMERIDEIVTKFTPNPDVTYTAVIMNARGFERAKQYAPPLTLSTGGPPSLFCHMCDVFAQRNTNRTQMAEIAGWPATVKSALKREVKRAGIGISAVWGSNFLGEFTLESQITMLEAQHRRWDEAGITVTSCGLVDTMSFATPDRVEELIGLIKSRWPAICEFRLHLHNARNMALASIYAAMRVLGPKDSLRLDGSIGGIGGCPYCGNGQATGTVPTEDLLHMFEGMGIETGVDMDRLIDCVWMAEEILGRTLYGHVSKAGPRPTSRAQYFDLNMPFVETIAQARHFKKGPAAYEGGIYPYKKPIATPYRERVESGLPPYDPPNGEFPWKRYRILT